MALHARWLGRVDYDDALGLQRALHAHTKQDYLLLLEHPHTYTMGVRADAANILIDPHEVGAQLVRADRGGDVTYHGPGQLVGYPIVTLADHEAGEMPSTRDHVLNLEHLLIDVLSDFGIGDASVIEGSPGVWIGAGTSRPRKIAAIGVRISRGRSMHGFALNVHPDPAMFSHIVPCGITDKGVTSMALEGVDATMREVVDAVCARAQQRWSALDRADVVWRQRHDDADLSPFSRGEGPGAAVRYSSSVRQSDGTSLRLLGRLAEAGVEEQVAITEPKPEWMRAPMKLDAGVLKLRSHLREQRLVTVCEEAGCPNLSECWSDGTATFMVCGERCTRACGFCLVDTRKPEALDVDEPRRVAEAAAAMGLRFAVITMVARDDLPDGGAAHVAATIRAIHERVPGAGVEALTSDFRGDDASLRLVFDARPEVFNHNIETVARMQRAVRPSASYARSLSVLGRGVAAGLTTKSGFVAGMGETFDEVVQTLRDLAAVGTSIVTIGQYLRPTAHHLPVQRWWTPAEFAEWKRIGEEEFGISHVESSPLTRSSYHARDAAEASASGLARSAGPGPVAVSIGSRHG
ncbi:MAG TPA: lipoyl synthase [Microthrixaceae bacterium]|nr:lipoyl synthase [Microthrixaceae bacterium]